MIDLLVQLWRGKMTIIISVIVAIALAIGYLAVAKEKWTSTAIVTQPDVGQIAGYTNAMNVIYGPAVPKVSDIQTSLIGRYSTAFSALAETLDNQEEAEKLTIEPTVKTSRYHWRCLMLVKQLKVRRNSWRSISSKLTTRLMKNWKKT
ncbi:O-antigen chain length determinant Wzz [Escherichia coli]|uniref:O-antigen chain length determinant Wzz n=1 Tax=Escherichia coli TaxID=562 RepID=A0A485JGB3_ECOLX|nr:O-antigen chain length determinant Wzz [Escherichia coli]